MAKESTTLYLNKNEIPTQTLESDYLALKEEHNRLTEELNQFSYAVSHDLQAPLRHINVYAEILSEELESLNVSEEVHKAIEVLQDSAKRSQKMIEDIRQYSSAGRAQLEIKNIDTQKIISSIFLMLTEEIENSNAKIIVKDLPTINGDEKLITTLFHQLIKNALKYCVPNQIPQIEISAKPHKGKILFVISDNGTGIAKDDLERSFKMFQKIPNAYKSSGVGLAICKKIIERHKGEIWIESDLAQGTRVSFLI